MDRVLLTKKRLALQNVDFNVIPGVIDQSYYKTAPDSGHSRLHPLCGKEAMAVFGHYTFDGACPRNPGPETSFKMT